MIVDIFGTWCPNCHDEAPLLEQLYRKYRAQGLVIVGLAYEYVDDTARDWRQIGIYREKYGSTFPLLLAGTTDAGQIEKTLPQLVNFGAYPTTIFLDRNGRVHAIHAGLPGHRPERNTRKCSSTWTNSRARSWGRRIRAAASQAL